MVQVIQSNRQKQPTFSQSILGGLSQSVPQAFQEHFSNKRNQQEIAQENEAAKRMGIDLSGISDPNVRQKVMSEALRGQENEKQFNRESLFKNEEINRKTQQEQENKNLPLQSALERVGKMKDIRKKNNLGRGSAVLGFFGGETAKDRGAYETLGNSLIQYATTIPIRNRVEFEQLAGRISDPSITDSEAEGILDELEGIIKDGLSGNESEEMDENILNDLSDNQIQELYKESNGDINRAKKLAMKRYGRK